MRNACAGLILWIVSCPLVIAAGVGGTPSPEQKTIPEFRDCVIEQGSWSKCINALPEKSPLRGYAEGNKNDSTIGSRNDPNGNHSYDYLFDQSSFPFLKGGIWSKTSAELFLERRKLDRAPGRGNGYPSPSESLM